MLVDVKTQVKMLVQQAVETYLKEKMVPKKDVPIAILLGYQSPNPTAVLEAVTPLLDTYNVTLLFTKEWLPIQEKMKGLFSVLIEDMSQQELTELIDQSSVLVIPQASYSLLSKLALTMDDETAVWVAIQYQFLGKPIVIANNGVEPNVYQQIHAPHPVQERIQSYIRRIRADQVKWVPLSKLVKTVDEQYAAYHDKQSLILAKHVERAFQEGLREIEVPEKSRVTPSAKDLARELKIQIKAFDSSKGGTV
ncbi:hypothetical protein ACSU64_06490 [Bacillaceae bacterium C204]|uniref:hypothetical protein n=1 Tax=Neobacillus sp. 204 TaxID=3383351 RepID=UPI0039793DBB